MEHTVHCKAKHKECKHNDSNELYHLLSLQIGAHRHKAKNNNNNKKSNNSLSLKHTHRHTYRHTHTKKQKNSRTHAHTYTHNTHTHTHTHTLYIYIYITPCTSLQWRLIGSHTHRSICVQLQPTTCTLGSVSWIFYVLLRSHGVRTDTEMSVLMFSLSCKALSVSRR